MTIARIASNLIDRFRKTRWKPTPPAASRPADWIDFDSLLGRSPMPLCATIVERAVRGRSIMITGAGGSIGTGLCRTVARHRPRRIVLVERSEFALYEITRMLDELRRTDPDVRQIEIIPCLADCGDRPRMTSIMRERQVDCVYHAAAFKHVPIVEHNEIEGIRNNSFATWRTALAAIDADVSSFVLISTDKAVQPVGVMGATKRLAELVIQSLALESGSRTQAPRFSIVRFGNVLDSSGSVVPLFREQIARGGPLTITHEEVSRFFMTIPEATGLVVQAGALSQEESDRSRSSGIYVLDMGDRVSIMALARHMVEQAGYRVDTGRGHSGHIEIRITGLRPGEKLHEELTLGEDLQPTTHPRILRCASEEIPWSTMEANLHRLEAATDRHDVREARRQLEEIISDYDPASELRHRRPTSEPTSRL
ncbi:MAG: UDP-N-acetylglucosamine 4,6-dehydratase family protein [Planctomycetota bacterium]|nr:UDP-N-acetylglucosamine 4,6-dehydratase family protein [Planctomycetota bacterium]